MFTKILGEQIIDLLNYGDENELSVIKDVLVQRKVDYTFFLELTNKLKPKSNVIYTEDKIQSLHLRWVELCYITEWKPMFFACFKEETEFNHSQFNFLRRGGLTSDEDSDSDLDNEEQARKR